MIGMRRPRERWQRGQREREEGVLAEGEMVCERGDGETRRVGGRADDAVHLGKGLDSDESWLCASRRQTSHSGERSLSCAKTTQVLNPTALTHVACMAWIGCRRAPHSPQTLELLPFGTIAGAVYTAARGECRLINRAPIARARVRTLCLSAQSPRICRVAALFHASRPARSPPRSSVHSAASTHR
jgi:hypothetical protein